MSSEKTIIFKRLSLILTVVIAVVAAFTYLVGVKLQPYLASLIDPLEARASLWVAVVFMALAGILIVSALLANAITPFVEWLLTRRKGVFHGWWVYVFLFDAKEKDKGFVRFSHRSKDKVLVIGYLQIYHDYFGIEVVDGMGTSKTFEKGNYQLHERVHLTVKNIDYRNDGIILVYETRKTDWVQRYRGIMDWGGKARATVIRESESFRTLSLPRSPQAFVGLIQDIEEGLPILENTIYFQHLKSAKNESDVEEVLRLNADNIINFVKENSNATIVA